LGLGIHLPPRRPACAVVAGYRFGLMFPKEKKRQNSQTQSKLIEWSAAQEQ
jgi:hypothetical protein